VRFGIAKDWIKGVLENRPQSPMTTTFGNLVDENYQSTSSLPELTLVFMNLQDTLEIPEEILRTACSSIVQNQRLFDGKSDFLSLISIRAFELLIV
jgi:hypothetical protein